MKDWIEFKKSFSQEQEDALWQYFIDHSKIQKNGYYGIQFYVRDIDDFWRRLFARFTGEFRRYDKLEKAHKNAMIEYWMYQKRANALGKVCEKIDKTGSMRDKIMLFAYRKAREYLLKKNALT